jgi:putative ABC transport system permease protein
LTGKYAGEEARMITWLKIGLRNLIKNRRRSGITISAIAIGFAAVNLFGGFQEYMYRGNRESAIYAGYQGHIIIFKKGYLKKGRLHPSRYLLNPSELQAIVDICEKNPHVLLITPQLWISGIVTNGYSSTIFLAQGIDPSAMDAFLDQSKYFKELGIQFEGKKLDNDKFYGVAIASDLASLLDLKPGSYAVALTNTVEGQMNALDMEVFNIFESGVEELKDKWMLVPYRFAQSLYDTQGADRIAVLLDEVGNTEHVRAQLVAAFSQLGLDFEIKTWDEFSQWYRDVKNMFDMIFLFLFIIMFVIVVMSVTNTMSMSVLERTREIGTLRALGLKRQGILVLFAIESILLGICGLIGGVFLSLLGWGWFKFFEPMWNPPRISILIPMRIEIVPAYLVCSFFLLLILCMIAALIPARRAALQNVIEALGHV